MDTRAIVAYILGCKPNELLGFSHISEDMIKAVDPYGRVHFFSHGFLQRTAIKLDIAITGATQDEINAILAPEHDPTVADLVSDLAETIARQARNPAAKAAKKSQRSQRLRGEK